MQKSTDTPYGLGHEWTHWTGPCSMFKSMLHVQVHAARTWTCSIELDIQIGHGHATWSRTCRMAMTCSMGKYMLLIHIHVHVHVHATYPSTCSVSMFIVHAWVHAACLSRNGTGMDMRIQHRRVHAAWTCAIEHEHGHEPRYAVDAIEMGRHAAWTWTCSIDMDKDKNKTWIYIHFGIIRPVRTADNFIFRNL
jgi:hypothetical protein